MSDFVPQRAWHPRMSELNPTLIRMEDGSCCVRGCESVGSVRRITQHGYFLIRYCPNCERVATAHFGAEHFEAIA